jgi:hypothetical protein
MARFDEFGNDGRTNKSGCAGEKNPHDLLLGWDRYFLVVLCCELQ